MSESRMSKIRKTPKLGHLGLSDFGHFWGIFFYKKHGRFWKFRVINFFIKQSRLVFRFLPSWGNTVPKSEQKSSRLNLNYIVRILDVDCIMKRDNFKVPEGSSPKVSSSSSVKSSLVTLATLVKPDLRARPLAAL